MPTEIWVALLGLSPRVLLDERLQSTDPHPSPSHSLPPPAALTSPQMFNDHIYPPAKDYVSQPLYVRQPCSLQIIQLVECSPPPPPQRQQQKYSPSRLSPSSYSDSDSDSDSDDGSAYDSSSSSLSAGSSYCSSVEEGSSSAPQVPPSFDNRDPSVDDTYHTRQRRVSIWRDAVYSKDVVSSPLSSSNTSGSSVSLSSRWGCGMFTQKFASSHARMHSSSRFSFPKAKNSRW